MLKRVWKKIRPGLRGEKGQSIVEFAIVLPLILVITTAAIDCGWCIYQRVTLEEAADGLAKSIHDGTSESNMRGYLHDNYPALDLNNIEINAGRNTSRLEYDEYIYRSDEDTHWKVPMYYERGRTCLKLTYKVRYLTPWGKLIFGTSDNYKELQTTSVAVQILDNDAR